MFVYMCNWPVLCLVGHPKISVDKFMTKWAMAAAAVAARGRKLFLSLKGQILSLFLSSSVVRLDEGGFQSESIALRTSGCQLPPGWTQMGN